MLRSAIDPPRPPSFQFTPSTAGWDAGAGSRIALTGISAAETDSGIENATPTTPDSVVVDSSHDFIRLVLFTRPPAQPCRLYPTENRNRKALVCLLISNCPHCGDCVTRFC